MFDQAQDGGGGEGNFGEGREIEPSVSGHRGLGWHGLRHAGHPQVATGGILQCEHGTRNAAGGDGRPHRGESAVDHG